MQATATTNIQRSPDLLLSLHAGGDCVAARLIDLKTDYPLLLKELLWRAVADNPRRAGWPATISVDPDTGGGQPGLVFQVEARCSGLPAHSVRVPAENFSWLGQIIAQEKGLTGNVTLRVSVPDPGLWGEIDAWRERTQTTRGVSFQKRSDPMRFPASSLFDVAPGLSRHFGSGSGDAYVRGIFMERAWNDLVRVASLEHETERHFLGLTRAAVDRPHVYIFIDRLVEVPASSRSRYGVSSRGLVLQNLRRRLLDSGDARQVACYSHLHPGASEDITKPEIACQPSGADTVTFWNYDRLTLPPAVFTISPFGVPRDEIEKKTTLWSYSRGITISTAWRIV